VTVLAIGTDGAIRAVYSEEIDLRGLAAGLGELSIRRASHVEPAADGTWEADLRPVGGPLLVGFQLRSAALAAELRWLDEHLGGLRG